MSFFHAFHEDSALVKFDHIGPCLIIGGTGTLGMAVIKRLLSMKDPPKITVLSRDELKQKKLKQQFKEIDCVIGDIKDEESLEEACRGKFAVFHFAALKHIDVAEDNPLECIKTNVFGTLNVAKACLRNQVKFCVFSSTDKAVLPINTYGMTKAISEKYLVELNRTQSETRFRIFRWGNVIGSRGSVLHSFVKSLKKDKAVYITDEQMTRFWINIEDAADFLVKNFDYINDEREVIIPPMKSASVMRLADLTARHINVADYKIHFSGVRRGEKYHECISSEHDKCVRSDNCEVYSDEELAALISRSLEVG